MELPPHDRRDLDHGLLYLCKRRRPAQLRPQQLHRVIRYIADSLVAHRSHWLFPTALRLLRHEHHETTSAASVPRTLASPARTTRPPGSGWDPHPCVITDPLDPITLGPDTSIDVVLWPAQFQWLWVGAFTAGDFDENLVYEIEAQGSGGFSIDGEGASVSVDGSGLGLVRGFCVRARQTFANYPLLVHITRTPIGQNNGNLNLLLAGRLGYLPP